MPDYFGVDIAGIIATEIGPGVLPATLIKVTPGTRDPFNVTIGMRPTETIFTGRGFIDDYQDKQIDGTLVKTGDRKITLIGDTFSAIPEPTDKIIIEGFTHRIVNPVKRDPAAATYECQCRR